MPCMFYVIYWDLNWWFGYDYAYETWLDELVEYGHEIGMHDKSMVDW